jgi:threonine/homoserine/homoserine lactone efflux protein
MQLIKVLPGFALTTLILAMVPGQGVAMVLRQSLLGGSRAEGIHFYKWFPKAIVDCL